MSPWIFKTLSPPSALMVPIPWIFLGIFLVAAGGCSGADSEAPSSVTGKVSVPLADARIYIYGKGEDIYGPAQFISEPTSADGTFSLALKPGEYVAVVRKRVSEDVAGPVLIGDYRGEPIPFEVEEGQQGISLALRSPGENHRPRARWRLAGCTRHHARLSTKGWIE